ncbi:MAG: SAM-dependent methyltransferase [Methylobacteriaceae bacterium]|nr:SAM-dependent methyltransferase [Methylobacteriaceae bacterium]MBV9221009.1 SAM-dependent methyltransferase [Methylobacteriaceae bacterium]MBV9637857.1 SAM-dependent methyltransferase [Methylobacteriaceae bacterium]
MTQSTARFMAMKGAGYYSKATTGAKHVIDGAVPLVLDALGRMKLADDGSVFRAADMGAADGGTSIDLWRKVLRAVRIRAPSRPIEMVYTDLPRNDFAQVFRVIHGQTDIASYLPEIDNLYVFAAGTSFHNAIFPPASLHFGFSATASHYIARTPCNIPNHVHMVGATGAEREAYVAQGRADWERLLMARAQELVPGGRLCLLNFGIDEAGRYLGHTGGASMFDTFDRLWRGLVEDGMIIRQEYENTNFPQVYRTIDEFVAPLQDRTSPVYRAGLRLEHVETRVLRCPYAREFERHGDAAAFARAYIPTLRSWSEPTFEAGLAPARLAEERERILDEFYGRYQALVERTPQDHAMDYVHVHLICAKEEG